MKCKGIIPHRLSHHLVQGVENSPQSDHIYCAWCLGKSALKPLPEIFLRDLLKFRQVQAHSKYSRIQVFKVFKYSKLPKPTTKNTLRDLLKFRPVQKAVFILVKLPKGSFNTAFPVKSLQVIHQNNYTTSPSSPPTSSSSSQTKHTSLDRFV